MAVHHDICRVTDGALTRVGLAYTIGQDAFIHNMTAESGEIKTNPFSEEGLSRAWQAGFSSEYADHQTVVTKGARMIGFHRRLK